MSEITVLIWLALAISVLVLIQLAVLGTMLALVFKARSKGRQIERNLLASGVDLNALAGTSYRLLQDLHAAMAESVTAAHALKQWGGKARAQLVAVSAALHGTLELMERMRDLLRRFTFS